MDPPYTNVAHYVKIRKESPLYDLLLTERLGVNSYHHQAVKKLGTDLEIMAESEDGLIEAIRHTKKASYGPFNGIQNLTFMSIRTAGRFLTHL